MFKKILILSAMSAGALFGCATQTALTPEMSDAAQPYDETKSRALNLLGLCYEEADRLEDMHYEDSLRPGGAFTGHVTGVLRADTFRRPNVFGFLPKDAAKTHEEARVVFTERVVDHVKAVFKEKGYRVVDGQKTQKDGQTYYSVFIAKAGTGCEFPANKKDLEKVDETATCRVQVSTGGLPLRGTAQTANGFSVTPSWANVATQYGWRCSDHVLTSKTWILKAKESELWTPTRLTKLAKKLGSGEYLFSIHPETHEPFVYELGAAQRFIEPEAASQVRQEKESKLTVEKVKDAPRRVWKSLIGTK